MSYNIKNEDGTLTLIAGITNSGGGGGGGTTNYEDLSNKPKINGHTLTGNKTGEQLGLVPDLTDYLKKENLTDGSITGIKIENASDGSKYTNITDQTIQTKNIYPNQDSLTIGRTNDTIKIKGTIDEPVKTSVTAFADNEFVTKEYVDNKIVDTANQSDWAEEDEDSISFIKNKPTNLVDSDELTRRINGLNLNQYFKKTGDTITSGTAGEKSIQATPTGLTGVADSNDNKPEIRNFDIYDGDKKLEDKYVQKEVAATGKETVTIQGGTGAVNTVIDGQSITTNTITSTTLAVGSINDENAAFEIDDEGNARFNNLNIEGNITAESIEINGKSVENVQSDWEETNNLSDAFIKNKPNLDSYATMTWVEEQINELSPEPGQTLVQVNSDWNETDNTKKSYILNKPENILTRDNLTDGSITEIDLGTGVVLKDTGIKGNKTSTTIEDMKTINTYDLFAENSVDVGTGSEGIVIDGTSIVANLENSTIGGFKTIEAETLKENGLSLTNIYVSKEQLYEGANILKGKLSLGDPEDNDYIKDTKEILNDIKTRMGGLKLTVFNKAFPANAIDTADTASGNNLAVIPAIIYSQDDNGEELKHNYATIAANTPIVFAKGSELNNKVGTGSWFTIDGSDLRFYPRKDWGYDNNIDLTDDENAHIGYKVIEGFNISGGDTIEANTSITAPTINADTLNITGGISIENFDTTNISAETISGAGSEETTLDLSANAITINGSDSVNVISNEGIILTGDTNITGYITLNKDVTVANGKTVDIGSSSNKINNFYVKDVYAENGIETKNITVETITGSKDGSDKGLVVDGSLYVDSPRGIVFNAQESIVFDGAENYISGHIYPMENSNFSIGSDGQRFSEIYAVDFNASNTITADSIDVDSNLTADKFYFKNSISTDKIMSRFQEKPKLSMTYDNVANRAVYEFQGPASWNEVADYAQAEATLIHNNNDGILFTYNTPIADIENGFGSQVLISPFGLNGTSGLTAGNVSFKPIINNFTIQNSKIENLNEALIMQTAELNLNSSLSSAIEEESQGITRLVRTLINCINALEARIAALEG